MPPSYERRRSPNTRSWTRSPQMDRRSTLASRENSEQSDDSGDSFRVRSLHKKRGDANFVRRQIDDDGPDDRLGLVGDRDSESDADSFDGSDGFDDSEIDEYIPDRIIIPTSTSSSRSILTLTALPPSQATNGPESINSPSLRRPSPSPTPPALLAPVDPVNPGLILLPSTVLREGAGPDTTILPSINTEVLSTSTPASSQLQTATTSAIGQTPSSEFSMDDDDNDGIWVKWRVEGDRDLPGRQLDPTAEHVLIAVGSIGAFILFCFISWIIYRVFKRSRGQSFGGPSGMGFIDKFPWKRKGPVEGTWNGTPVRGANEAPPIYEKGEYGTMPAYYAPGGVARPIARNSEAGTLPQPLNVNPVHLGIADHYEAGNANANLTMRSQAPDPYYNQSDVAQQPPEAYLPARRSNRTSEISSISSGFGDGDIIVPQNLSMSMPMPAPVPLADSAGGADGPEKPAPRDSWVSRDGDRRQSRRESRRETIYTTTSEDRPARFRSIGSWVNQQAGRAKRARSRARERGEVPVMPAIPGELSMTRSTMYR
ncbi:hypothetical protein GGS23DRAFT_56052 [Durotheca rogersii]|uniref:uncharacterized protein n=1 Tax=Durotheca rogersii TaxID=419775 RepID=UPI002220AE9C|nr:uncharacterized protein GGS23DRAFT_56052 [Durotheca rogersii]KAI5863160.1 hypothetical protein GGS23DRAFT_56052 [Durotheca rogersii]